MFYGEKKKIFLDNLVRSLREIVRYAEKRKIKVMLENVPVSNGIHDVVEFKYIIDNIASLFVHLDIPHAFTSGGMESLSKKEAGSNQLRRKTSGDRILGSRRTCTRLT